MRLGACSRAFEPSTAAPSSMLSRQCVRRILVGRAAKGFPNGYRSSQSHSPRRIGPFAQTISSPGALAHLRVSCASRGRGPGKQSTDCGRDFVISARADARHPALETGHLLPFTDAVAIMAFDVQHRPSSERVPALDAQRRNLCRARHAGPYGRRFHEVSRLRSWI